MPQVLTMSNGRPETILSPKDFEDLVESTWLLIRS